MLSVVLASGKKLTFRRLPNGAEEIVEDISCAEWEEYCAICVESNRKLAAKVKSIAKDGGN